jgi:hypothetical protein
MTSLRRSTKRLAGLALASLLTGAFLFSDSAARQEAISSSVHCGVERWDVKTLSDPATSKVNFEPKATTVAALWRKRRPASIGPHAPRTGATERMTYRVTATLVKARWIQKNPKEDHDIHLVIADRDQPEKTMIVEFPDVACEGAAVSKKKTQMRNARRAFTDACGTPPKSTFARYTGTAKVTGVGFFDNRIHGSGAAKTNGIELHPVLRFSSTDCMRFLP